VISVTKSVTVTSTNCPSGASPSPPAGTACPGGVLTYSLAYADVGPAASVGTHVGTEPYAAYTALEGWAINVFEDGSGYGAYANVGSGAASNGGTWGASSFGLNAAPADTTSGTTYTYYLCTAVNACPTTSTFSTGTYPSKTAGPNVFSALIGGVNYMLPVGGSGTITYNVTVK
jgi:hypothetical protein